MAKRTGLAAWLRAGGTERVAAVLAQRPDVVAPPPAGLAELAERLSARASVLRVVDRLDRPCLQVVETLQLLGDGARRDDLERLHGGGPDLERALGRLVELALVWPDGTQWVRLAAAARSLTAAPHGLGERLRPLLTTLGAAAQRDLAERTGCPPGSDLHAYLVDPGRVRAVAVEAPPEVAGLLERLVRGSPRLPGVYRAHPLDTVFGPPEVRWLMERGLVFGSSWSTVDLPCEVALALRGPVALPLDPEPPSPLRGAVDVGAVDAAAGRAALAALDGVIRVVEACEATPVAQLKTGGVGVRELRRLAKLLRAQEADVRLWLELAAAAGLVAVAGAEVLPAEGFDGWRAADPAARLAVLLRAWWELPVVPSAPLRDIDGARPPALGPGLRGLGRVLRRAVLTELARGSAADATALWPLPAWRHPTLLGSTEMREEAGPATLAECTALGVVALGARSALAEALLAGADLAAAAVGLLPRPVGEVRLLPDLSAVVAGTPSSSLAGLLDRVAVRESRDTASTWRFTPASVRAALDAGETADGLRTALAAVSLGELPQPLVYLLRDVGRRHGRLQVRPLECAVVSEDEALLVEVAAHRALRACGLRPLAPTVLASGVPVERTLELLRDAGYAPVALDAGGALRLDLRRPPRAAQPPPVRRTSDAAPGPAPGALAALAATLLARDDGHTTRSSLTLHHVRRHSAELEPMEVLTLAHAVDRGLPVLIDYIDSGGIATRQVVEPVEFLPPMLVAWCRLQGDERSFMLDRIVAVSPA